MAGERILVVDDERDILELITYNLGREGYRVETVTSGEAALATTRTFRPDLIVLDLMLPGLDGVEVCRRLKQNDDTGHIPVLMLTAKSEDADVVTGLEIGADDYVTKPFSPRVLVARIRAALRRVSAVTAAPSIVEVHGISIDLARHEVRTAGATVELSPTEFAVLEFLARNPGWVYSRAQIIDGVKGPDYPVTERSVDVQILGLRKKLGNAGTVVETVRGVGYRMKS